MGGGVDVLTRWKIDELSKKVEELSKEKEEQEKKKSEEFTLGQQLLLLHYLGLIDNIDLTNKSKSLYLSKVLNRSQENIRKNITYINSPKIEHSKIKNRENLEVVKQVFEELKLSEIVANIEKDLSKITEQ